MKLIIFGATGGTGQQLVKQALKQGHTVTAFTRNPHKMTYKHENLHLLQSDVLDYPSVEKAIQGQDTVLCSLGTPAMNKKQLRAKGTRNIIQAMEKTGVDRFICQSGLGCGDSYSLLPFRHKYIIFPLFLRHAYADHEIQERQIRESQLDWTIVRPAALTNGKHTGSYWQGVNAPDKSLSIKISRADVADSMLKQITNNHYLHKAPSLSY